MGVAEVLESEVWKDGASSIVGGFEGLVRGIPPVVKVGENFHAVLGAEKEVLLSFIGLVLLCQQVANKVVKLWVAILVFSGRNSPPRPSFSFHTLLSGSSHLLQRLMDEPLARGFLGRDGIQQLVYPPYLPSVAVPIPLVSIKRTLVLRRRRIFGILVDLYQQQTQVSAASSLSSLQQRQSSGKDNLNGGIKVACFYIALAKDSELLVGLIVGSFLNPVIFQHVSRAPHCHILTASEAAVLSSLPFCWTCLAMLLLRGLWWGATIL